MVQNVKQRENIIKLTQKFKTWKLEKTTNKYELLFKWNSLGNEAAATELIEFFARFKNLTGAVSAKSSLVIELMSFDDRST